ncbi:ketoacyl-synt-domain-containing protein, partial [Penicillium vulpinum]
DVLDKLNIADWSTSKPILAQIRSASSHVRLSASKSYLLLGMQKDLAMSISEWMVSRGARHVVFAGTACDINFDKGWVEDMATNGAGIHCLTTDISNRQSVLLLERFTRALPPVGGMIYGALAQLPPDNIVPMTPQNGYSSPITYLLEISIMLDELYNHPSMEFFIFVGSLSGHFGHSNMVNCAAASEFSSALIHQRRSRGFCGSIVFVSQISDPKSESKFPGQKSLSEHDWDEVFAEAILAGDPESTENFEITAGLRPIKPEHPEMSWNRMPKMWNFVHHHEESNVVLPSSSVVITMSVLLERATSQEEVTEIITSHLLAQLRTKLGLSMEAVLVPETQLSELGVDSLMAADLRTWFLKKLGVDIPILLMLSGSSIQVIASSAADKLDPNTIPHVN